jgi:hypothetical protein
MQETLFPAVLLLFGHAIIAQIAQRALLPIVLLLLHVWLLQQLSSNGYIHNIKHKLRLELKIKIKTS